MTRVVFYRKNSMLIGFSVMGHSGYAEAGSDIVCAAVTSAVRLTEVILSSVADVQTETEPEKPCISLWAASSDGQVGRVLEAVQQYLKQLARENPCFLKCLEVLSC